MQKMIPQIEIMPYPINSSIDVLEDNDVNYLYYVHVSQANLKMKFLVERKDTRNSKNAREFEVQFCEELYLHGIDERDEYLDRTLTTSLSADVTIVRNIFKSILDAYSIELTGVVFYDFECFGSARHQISFSDDLKYETLKDLINNKCKKMMSNHKVLQF